jgi:hypothetical protein
MKIVLRWEDRPVAKNFKAQKDVGAARGAADIFSN